MKALLETILEKLSPRKGIQITESEKFLLPESWALGSGIQLKESGIPITIGIQNSSPTDKDLESGIHCVESRIQDCLGFPACMGVKTNWTIGTNGPSELPCTQPGHTRE